MTEHHVALHGEHLPEEIERVVEQCCAAEGLAVTMRGTLRGYPGCVHWHLKRGRERGTLEITSWPDGRRLWLSVQSGRDGEWTESTALRLHATLEARLRIL